MAPHPDARSPRIPGSTPRALPLPAQSHADSPEPDPADLPDDDGRESDVTSLRFRFGWLRNRPGVNGYAVQAPGEDWILSGEANAAQAAQAWFIGQLGEALEDRLGLEGFCRADLRGEDRRLVTTTTPDGMALVLWLDADLALAPLLTQLGVER